MIYSKANLAVRDAASPDKRDVALHRVHFEPDGTTAAASPDGVMAVSPPDPVRAGRFPRLEDAEAAPPPEGVGVPPGYVAAVARAVPAGRSVLHYAQMTRCSEREVELMTTNGHEKLKRGSVPCRGRFPRWRGVVGAACRRATRGRVCVNRAALIKMLQALDRACPDRGNSNPVFIEFGGEGDLLVMRSENCALGQRAVAVVRPLDTGGYWMEPDDWEREVRDAGADGGGRDGAVRVGRGAGSSETGREAVDARPRAVGGAGVVGGGDGGGSARVACRVAGTRKARKVRRR